MRGFYAYAFLVCLACGMIYIHDEGRFASAPAKHEDGWMPKPKTLCRIASEPELNWRETLEHRPE